MKKILFLLILTTFCLTLISPQHNFAQHFVDGQIPDTFLAGHTSNVNSVTFSPDGETIASGSTDATVKLWDVATGTLKATLERHIDFFSPEARNSVAFRPDGRTIASGSLDETVKLWDVATGTLKATLEGHTDLVRSVAFSPDGRTIASGAGDYVESDDPISRQGTLYYPVSVRDATVKLWDVATGTLKATLEGHTGPVNSVAFSPDGRTIASGSDGRFYYTPTAHGDFFTITRGTIKLWDVATGTLKHTLKLYKRFDNLEKQSAFRGTGRSYGIIYDVAFSPDGKTIASTHRDYSIVSHEVTNWWSSERFWVLLYAQLAVDAHGNMPFRSRMIRDYHVTETYRDVIHLWDVASGSLKATLEGHTDSVNSVAFSPDGSIIASGSADATVKLWDVSRPFQSRVPKATLSEHGRSVSSVAFSPDGTRLASGCDDNVVRLWIALPLGNNDGVANIADLVEVAQNFGQVGQNNADINGDGIVNVVDLILVAVALGEVAAAPAAHAQALSMLTAEEVEQWLIEAKQLQTEDPMYVQGVLFLEQLLALLSPKETVLLANYPNPFNPETWIPYQLATSADVMLTIYDINGHVVRALDLGHRAAGIYQRRGRAAYWDGRNAQGEPVASGGLFLYAYHRRLHGNAEDVNTKIAPLIRYRAFRQGVSMAPCLFCQDLRRISR